CVLGLIAFAACGGDSTGPGRLSQADIKGTWVLTAGPGSGTRPCGTVPPLLVPFVSDGVDLGNDTFQFVDPWYFQSDPSRTFGPFAAQISLDGHTHLQLNRTLSDATLIEGT